MNFGVLGTGMVANSLATKLVALGHSVKMGSRTADNENAVQWSGENGEQASNGTFSDAAAFGEIIINSTLGSASIEALELAGEDNLSGKILIDAANPLIRGEYLALVPELSNTTSLGEEIQKRFPGARVVKTLNTMSADLMVEPGKLNDKHDIFICGDDDDAKAKVKDILRLFGWESPIDLGKLPNARYTERLGSLWVPIYLATNNPLFAFKVVTNN